jgi:hypothetical protein
MLRRTTALDPGRDTGAKIGGADDPRSVTEADCQREPVRILFLDKLQELLLGRSPCSPKPNGSVSGGARRARFIHLATGASWLPLCRREPGSRRSQSRGREVRARDSTSRARALASFMKVVASLGGVPS